MSQVVKCLDHGEIELIDSLGNDESIVRSARVSHAANEKTGQDPAADFKLIDYLYRNGHTSPFEHPVFTFRVKAPIFVFRQWHRHRTWSYNEVSARYTELPEEFYVPEPGTMGVQSKDNHQARDIEIQALDTEEKIRLKTIQTVLHWQNKESFDVYRQMLDLGCPRELARTVLPVATYSEMFATVDLHNLLKFISERISDGAQYEIKVYAQAMLELIEPLVPAAVAAWKAHRHK